GGKLYGQADRARHEQGGAEAGRGSHRGGDCRRHRRPRRTGQGKRRRALPPAGGAEGGEHSAGRSDGRTGQPHRPVGTRRKSRAQGAMMAKRSLALDPYRHFTKAEWSKLRDGQLMTLNESDIQRLRALTDPISLSEAEEIY